MQLRGTLLSLKFRVSHLVEMEKLKLVQTNFNEFSIQNLLLLAQIFEHPKL